MDKYDARGFALNAHGDQKYGPHPYGKHLQDVVTIVEPYGEEAVMVAWLHDVVEDTKVGLLEIDTAFGTPIANLVGMLTDPPGGLNRKTRKQKVNEKFAASGNEYKLSRIVKAADRLANVRFSVETEDAGKISMYRNEYTDFRRAVYRPGECNDIWLELDALMY